MEQHFHRLASLLDELCRPSECFTCYFRGENSDFVRLNRNRIRQAGGVHQIEVDLDLMEGARHVRGGLCLTGNSDQDCQALTELVLELRCQRQAVQEDPHLLYATEVNNTRDQTRVHLPSTQEMVAEIIEAAEGLDLVGVLASGPLYRGFANSFGQTNWYETASFHLSWSCYADADKAVKASYAGAEWDKEQLRHKIAELRTHLQTMTHPPVNLKPGDYPVYLAPAALNDILSMMSWGGFSLKSHQTLTTPLLKMVREGRTLNPAVTLSENNAQGTAPRFTPEGYLKPQAVSLIDAGQYRGSLVSPRSAKEFGQTVNAGGEYPDSLDMAAGDVPHAEVLKRLDRGLYLGNLWYCNFSDRNDCRITGMTRFACFWVEGGRIRAPVNVMRFDDSVYRMLGDQLLGLTREREFMPDDYTYGRRSTTSVRLPGALISKLTLTL